MYLLIRFVRRWRRQADELGTRLGQGNVRMWRRDECGHVGLRLDLGQNVGCTVAERLSMPSHQVVDTLGSIVPCVTLVGLAYQARWLVLRGLGHLKCFDEGSNVVAVHDNSMPSEHTHTHTQITLQSVQGIR